ncbi:MAG: DUF748 domain-containing protein [Burkholderiales bacterium]
MQKSTVRLGARPRVLDGHPRIRKTLWWLIGIVLFIAIAGFLVAPPIVKWQAQKRLSALLHRTVVIENVSINPFALSTRVDGFRVSERDGSGVVLGFDSFYARLSYETLVRLAPVVAEARLERPLLHLVRTPEKAYNFQDLVEEVSARPDSKSSEPEKPAQFSFNNLQLVDGMVEFDDQAKKQKHALTAINIAVPFVSNFDSHVKVFVQPRLEAVVNGDPLHITGETKPFDGTYETRVALNLTDVDLPRYLDYSPVPLPFSLSSGKFEAALSATFKQAARDAAQLVVSGNVTVREFALADAGGTPVFAFHQLGVVINSLDVFGRKVDVARVGLESPALDLRREKDGSLNLTRLVPTIPAGSEATSRSDASKSSAPFAFSVGEIAIANGTVKITDLMPEEPFQRRVEKLEARVRGLSSADKSRAGVELGFDSIAIGGEPSAPARFDYTGEVQLAPVKASGKVQVLQLKLGDLYPYYAAALNAEVLGGTADVSAAFDISIKDAAPSGRVTGIAATLSDFGLRLPETRAPFLKVASVTVQEGEVDLDGRSVTLGKVAIDRPAYAIERAADGTLNATRLVKPAPDAAAQATGSEPWVVTVTRLELARGSASIEDRTVKPSVKVALRNMTFTGDGLSTAKDAQGKVAFRTEVNRAGSISLQGRVSLEPSGTLAVAASKIDLVPFNPYLAPHMLVDLVSGNVSTRGSLAFRSGNDVRATYKGDLDISGLALRHEKEGADLLTWKSLRFAGLDVASEPLRVSVEEVALTDIFARVVLDANGQLNLRELAEDTPAGVAPVAPTPRAQAESTKTADAKPQNVAPGSPDERRPVDWLRVGRVRLENGNVDFSDFFVKPNYRANLTDLNGTISTLTFEQPGELEFTGKLNQAGALEIRGRVNPLAANIFLDMQAAARDIELPRLSPYSAKYLGYGIDRGKLSVKVKYLLEDRKLAAENNIYLDQLKLGEKNQSSDAPDLPISLAVSLLQDRNGVIDVNLPIGGSLDDPQFSIAGIVMQVIGNIITKAVTAPFALLGSVAGGGGDLDFLEFDPGSARLTAASEKKLDALGKALTDRPGLKLDVTGRADPASDRAGLKQAAVDNAVKRQKFDELRGTGKAPKSADEVVVDPKEYPALLKEAYSDADIPGKPRNFIGLAKDIPVPEMEKLMLASTSATDEDLRDLALRRAQAAKDYLTGPGKIPVERVFIVTPKVAAEDAKATVKPTRVEFALR